MSYLTAVPQSSDLWHCRLVDDGEGNMVCEEPYEDIPPNIIKTGELDGNNIYLSVKPIGQGTILGSWYHDGSIAMPVDPAYDALVPVGNKEGVATGKIDFHNWQGLNTRYRQEAIGRFIYPADNQPFALRITRTLTTDDDWSHIPWGWTVEMLSDDPERDITARAIGVYAQDGTYLYTTGAFVLMDFEEIDDEGNPVTVQRYGTICPIGQRTADSALVYFKLLLGSAPEGAWVLEDLEEGATQTRNFWQEDMP